MKNKIDKSKPPSKCPFCNGERDWSGVGDNAICCFCGIITREFANKRIKEVKNRPEQPK